jgi:ubiquitin carboxyl-terminal hydrolase 25/28
VLILDAPLVAHELKRLFQDLEGSDAQFVWPRQRLANAALLRPDKSRSVTDQASKGGEASSSTLPGNNEPPPLPPRNGQAGGSLKASGPSVTINAVPDKTETDSIKSSDTLVDQCETYVVVEHDGHKGNGGDDDRENNGTTEDLIDMEMKDMATNNAVEQTEPKAAGQGSESDKTSLAGSSKAKVTKLSVEELATELDKENIGSDQMDVDEVMGNAIEHLRAAFKVSTVGQTNSTTDPIKAAFFSTFVNSHKKVTDSTWTRTPEDHRWVTAYPAPEGSSGMISLHDALGPYFDRSVEDGTDRLSFTSIKTVAPYFHVFIQRSGARGKNSNPIDIPETLYLDRYIDTGDDTSQIRQRRKRGWDLKAHLKEIEKDPAVISSASARDKEDQPTASQLDEYE